MKKFTSIALALLAGTIGFSSYAQGLGEGMAVTESFSMIGGTTYSTAPSYASSLPTVLFYWGESPLHPTKISLVDPQQSSTMIPGQSNTYAPVKLTLPSGGEPVNMQATIYNTMGGTMLSVNLLSAAGGGYGEYTLTIPENTVQNEAEETNAETVYTVTYCSPGQAKLSPSDYQIAPADFTGATISFNGTFDKFVVADDVQIVKLINNSTLQLVKGWTSSEITVSEDKQSLSVNFDGLTFANNDKFQIQVTAGSFIYTSGDVIYLSPALSSGYFLFDGLAEAEILSGPETYTAPNFQPIMLTWDWQNIYPTSDEIEVEAYYYTYDGDKISIEIAPSAITLANIQKPEDGGGESPLADATYNVLRIDVAPYVEDIYGNQITVVVPEGVIANEKGKVNQETAIQFTIFPLTDCEVIFDEEGDGIYYLNWTIMDALSTISLNYYGPYEMYLLNSNGEQITTIENDPYGMYGYPAPGSFWLSGYSMLNGLPTEVYVDIEGNNLEDGIYTLLLPEALFILQVDGENYLTAAEEIEVMVGDWSGLNALDKEAAAEGYVVYNLKGVKVLESKDASSLNTLQKGLYIINGKKVMICK